MKRADPEKDMTRNTHNYFAHGGSELVIGGTSSTTTRWLMQTLFWTATLRRI